MRNVRDDISSNGELYGVLEVLDGKKSFNVRIKVPDHQVIDDVLGSVWIFIRKEALRIIGIHQIVYNPVKRIKRAPQVISIPF